MAKTTQGEPGRRLSHRRIGSRIAYEWWFWISRRGGAVIYPHDSTGRREVSADQFLSLRDGLTGSGSPGQDAPMGCLLILMTGFAPRLAAVLYWIWRPGLWDRAFSGSWMPRGTGQPPGWATTGRPFST